MEEEGVWMDWKDVKPVYGDECVIRSREGVDSEGVFPDIVVMNNVGGVGLICPAVSYGRQKL
jgi:hypothetical protein